MIATHTYRGLWWLPATPDEQLSGTLTITKGEPILELVGHFGPRLLSENETERAYSLDLADQKRIRGLTTDGKDVTLVDCSEAPVGNTISFPGIEVGAYRARVAIIGHTFGDGDPIEFDAVEMRTSELEKWIGYTPFPVKRHEERRGGVIGVHARKRRPGHAQVRGAHRRTRRR
jgi:ApeA N-terminal domain 1